MSHVPYSLDSGPGADAGRGSWLRRAPADALTVLQVALTVLYVALTVLCVALTVLYVALIVLYVALTVLYVALTVLRAALTVLYVRGGEDTRGRTTSRSGPRPAGGVPGAPLRGPFAQRAPRAAPESERE